MATIAILGAGTLGGALAHKLAQRDQLARVRLIDPAEGVAAGKALDIRQAGPVERFDTRVDAASIDGVVGAAAVVVADPAESENGDWEETGLALVKSVKSLTRHTPLILADASHHSLLSRTVEDGGFDPHRVLGTAPGAVVSALKTLVALEADASPKRVAINLLGTPPGSLVVPWSSATVNGCPVEKCLRPPKLARLRARANQLWPPGPYALASAATRVLEAIVAGESRDTFTCFIACEDRVACRAVTVCGSGIGSVLTPSLSPAEQVQLDNASGRR
ncbi:MAG: hypothetical protein VYE68_02545 [Acidobacteriota bacterium]|nr:hypothetical protein [Acidobacteriota bacterium]